MGLFSKLAFWKHDVALPVPDSGFGSADLGLPKDSFAMPTLEPSTPFGSSMQSGLSQGFSQNPFQTLAQQPAQPFANQQSTDLQLISSKLDTIKVLIENISPESSSKILSALELLINW